MKNNQEYNHVLKGIPNTQENRDKVAEFNKMARQSNSMHRIRIKYRKPKNGENGYYGGSCAKDDAQCFSLYLRKTEKQQKLDQEYRSKQFDRIHEYRLKYEKLQSKYNAMMLKPILQGLVDNIEELQYALEKGNHWFNIVNSLKGISQGINEDINNELEV